MKPLKPREVAERLNVSVSLVYKWARSGELPLVPLPGSVVRIDWDAFTGVKPRSQVSRSLKTKKNASNPYHQKGDTGWL